MRSAVIKELRLRAYEYARKHSFTGDKRKEEIVFQALKELWLTTPASKRKDIFTKLHETRRR